MTVRLLALAALLLVPAIGRSADVERARHPTCTGIYTGAARGVFWCKVSVVHDPKADRSTLKLELDDDAQLTGDALEVVPGGFSWKGAPAAGTLKSADASVTSAWMALQTGQIPDRQVDYAAGRASPRNPIDQGDLLLVLTNVQPGAVGEGGKSYVAHGTFSARLTPLPGAKGVGEVRVTVSF
jgi:hypothetical protein